VLSQQDPFRPQIAVRSDWLPPGAVCAAADERGQVWALNRRDDEVTLDVYRADSRLLLGSHALPSMVPTDIRRWHLVARAGQAFISWEDAVLILRLDAARQFNVEPIGERVHGLAVSAPHTRLRVAASLDEGGMLLWEDGTTQRFGEGLFHPSLTFTRGNSLVLLDPPGGRILRTGGNDVRHLADFTADKKPVLAVTPTDTLGGYAIFYADGSVTVCDVREE
jgi:hypothetical protein